jgi:predicted Zn finger-like uncharacterized protein
MIVTCSACKTRYLTDPTVLGPSGRMVRCAKCGHIWLQEPPADMPRRVDVTPPPDPANPPQPRFNLPVRYEPPPSRHFGLRLAAAVAAGLILLVGTGYFARERIIETWPPAKRVYELIGGLVGVPTSTLDVGNLQMVRQPIQGFDLLILQGEITNRGGEAQVVPPLRATLLDADDRGVMGWTFASSPPVLQPGETGRFRTQAINPPDAVERLKITFVDTGG